MIRHTRRARGALVLLVTLTASPSFGAILYEGFDYPTGAIAGRNGGTGFAGAWTGAGDVGEVNSLFYNRGGAPLRLETSGLQYRTGGIDAAAFRTLAAPINTDTGTLWISFLSKLNSNQMPSYSGLSLFSGGTSTEELFLGAPFQQQKYGFDVSGVAGGMKIGDTAFVNNVFSSDFLVYRLNFTPDGETIDFFYNPDEDGPTPATPTATFAIPEGSFADTLTAIRLQSGGASGSAIPVNYDEIRLGNTFAEVSPTVPEPGALGVIGAGGLLLLRRRAAR